MFVLVTNGEVIKTNILTMQEALKLALELKTKYPKPITVKTIN